MGSSRWGYVTDWYIDPAQTHGGSDENDGLTSATPIKSIAEWRRRVKGATYGKSGFPSKPVIHPLSSSSEPDDGHFYGFTCDSQSSFVCLLGTPTVISNPGGGTVTAVTPYSGNTRQSLTDSNMTAATWTAAGLVTNATQSRFIRKVGSGATPHAPIALDLGSKSVQLGVSTNIDDSVISFFPNPSEVSFQTGDAYEVVGFNAWPPITVGPSASVGQQCLDVKPSIAGVMNTFPGFARLRLCGIIGTGTYVCGPGGGGGNHYMCVFCITAPDGVALSNAGWFIGTSSFVNTIVAVSFTGPDLVAASSPVVFIASTVNIYKGVNMSLSGWRFYDFTAPLFNIQSRSTVGIEGAIVGTGNSGKLVSVSLGSSLSGASNITAATTDANPWQVTGVSHASPTVDASAGNGIYS